MKPQPKDGFSSATSRKGKRRALPKLVVQSRWPHSYSYKWAGPQGWVIYTGETINMTIGAGGSAKQAWADAKTRGIRP